MFLALAFGLFLGAPLALLAGSLGRTAVAVSRGRWVEPLDDAPAARTVAPAHASEPARKRTRPSLKLRGRRTRPAVANGTRRDFFGDSAAAAPVRPAVAMTSAVRRPIGQASAAGADVLAFRGRDAAMPSFRADAPRQANGA